jgi:hypothetical protein
MFFCEQLMKRNRKSILLSIFIVVSVITTINVFNLMNSEYSTRLQPESADLVSDLGVRVGDLIYYRLFDHDTEINGDGPLPQGLVMEYEITSMDGEEIISKMDTMYPNGSGIWGYYDHPDSYKTSQVFDDLLQFRMFQLTTITDYATASGITVENLDQAWRNEINSVSEPISTTYDSSSNTDYHLLNFGGYVDDNPSQERNMSIWIDKITGIVAILNDTEPGRKQYKELMGYVKGSDSILPDWTYPNPSNFHIGDILVTHLPDMDNPEDVDEDGPIGFGFFEHEIKFMYRNPDTLEDVIVVELRKWERIVLSGSVSTYMYKEESRTIENNPSSVFGSWSNYTNRADFDSLFFDQDIIPTIDPNEFGDMIAPAMDLVPGYSATRVGNSLKITGFDSLGRNAEFYIEGMIGYGFPKVQWTKYWNETDTEWNLEMTVDGTGVIESHPDIGLNEADINEGDYWVSISQTEFNSHNWFPSSPDEWHNESKHLISRFRVTHIFALNATVMAVFGVYTADYYQRPNFLAEYNIFQPLLIFDTNNPASFLTHGGFAPGIEGPPVLLPVVSNWSIYSSQLKSQLESDLAYGVSAIRSSITTNSIRLFWDEEEYNPPEMKHAHGHIILESNALGIVTHLDIKQYNAWDDGFGKGEEIQEEILMDCQNINGSDQNPDIPGYPMLFISVLAFASIVFIIQKSKK